MGNLPSSQVLDKSDKHSSLFCRNVGDEEKKKRFIGVDTLTSAATSWDPKTCSGNARATPGAPPEPSRRQTLLSAAASASASTSAAAETEKPFLLTPIDASRPAKG